MNVPVGYSPSGIFVYRYPATESEIDPPLLAMIHGSMDRGTSFARLHNSLPEIEGFSYDRRGYHRSGLQGSPPPSGIASQVDDFFEVLGGRTAAVFGHSFGGVIALAAAAWRPDLITSVVAFEPPLIWKDWWPRSKPGTQGISWADAPTPEYSAELFMRRMIGDERWERLPERTKIQRRAEGPALVAEISSLRLGPAPFNPATISIPVVIGRGSKTAQHQLRGTSEIVNEIPGAELIEIAGCGHGAHLTHPGELANMVRYCMDRKYNSN